MIPSPAATFGFGWPTLVVALAGALGIHQASGLLSAVFYVPFLGAAVHMTRRFHLFNRERWRRVHARAMRHYAPLAGRAFDAAKREGREFDVAVPCRELAAVLLPGLAPAELEKLLGAGRKAFFAGLVQASPEPFLQGVAPEGHAAVLKGIRRDIDASALGPDVVVARAIARELGPLEAARYFHARLLGQVN